MGSFQCKVAFFNATLIQCHAAYGAMYKELAVAVTVHGVGRAKCTANFMFALYVYSVSPAHASLAGGTEITLTTSTLPSAEDLGVHTFKVWCANNPSKKIAPALAGSLGVTIGIECSITSRVGNTIKCILGTADKSVIGATAPLDLPAQRLSLWLVAQRNT